MLSALSVGVPAARCCPAAESRRSGASDPPLRDDRRLSVLAGEAGIRQFLDIGVGLPVGASTHQIAQQAAPESRVVYVDNDPLVLVRARALWPAPRAA